MKAKIIIVVVACFIFLSIIFSPDSPEQNNTVISVDNAKNGSITTTDPAYKLVFSIKSNNTMNTEVSVNSTQQASPLTSATTSISDGKKKTYTYDLAYANLKYGDNNINITTKDIYNGDDSSASKNIVLILNATQSPIISVDKATGDDPLQLPSITDDKLDIKISTESSETKGSGAFSVSVNGVNVPSSISRGQFDYKSPLKEGLNEFTVVAKNNVGETTKKLVVTRISAQEAAAKRQIEDALFEADISCQRQAESYFNVNDINVSYDQSSIKRQNGDGTLLIKAKIADSRGLFRSQKPLGIMECTTDPTGMIVKSFEVY